MGDTGHELEGLGMIFWAVKITEFFNFIQTVKDKFPKSIFIFTIGIAYSIDFTVDCKGT